MQSQMAPIRADSGARMGAPMQDDSDEWAPGAGKVYTSAALLTRVCSDGG